MKSHNTTKLNSNLYFFSGVFLILWGLVGRHYDISTLLVALILMMVVLSYTLIQQKLSNFQLIDAWIVGFIYIFGGEYINGREIVLTTFDTHILAITEGYIVSAFGATLLGYSLCILPLLRTLVLNKHQIHKDTSNNILIKRRVAPVEVVFVLFALAFLLYLYTFIIRSPVEIFSTARAQRESLDSYIQIVNGILVCTPVFISYLLNRFQVSFLLRGIACLVGLWGLVIIAASGTRFWLAFSATGITFFLINGFQGVSNKQKSIIIGLLILFYVSQTAMLMFRAFGGVTDINLNQVIQESLAFDVQSEGILHINAWIHQTEYITTNDGRLPENLFIFYWWVPRQMWPDKPTMAGYWFIREETNIGGFGRGHSVSGGFSMPALLDFGPYLGIAFCITTGMLLACMEAFAYRYRYSVSPISILVGLLYFSVVFMIRSPQTSLIFLMIAGLGLVGPVNFIYNVSINYGRRFTRHNIS